MSLFQEGEACRLVPLARARGRTLLPAREEVAVALGDTSFAIYLNNRGDANLYEGVSKISRDLLQKNPNSYDGLRLKGYISMLDRHFPEAIETLKKANAVKPDQADLIDALMQCLIANNQFPEAEKLGLDLIQHQPTHGAVYDTLYAYYVANKRFADGEAIVRKKIDNNPNVLAYRLQMAGHFAAMGNEAGMSKAVQAITDNPSRFPTGFLEAGNFYFSIKRYDDALRTFQAGAKQDGEQKAACQKRAVEVLLAEKKWDQAMAAVQEMLRTDPHNFGARALRAEIDLDIGQPDRAAATLQELRDLIKQDANNAILHYNLGRAYVAVNDSTSALAEFSQAMKLDSRYLQPRLLAANLSMERQDFKEANRYANEILGLTGDNASARLLRVGSLTGMGNFNDAAKELNQLNRQYPNSPALKMQAGELMRAQKNYKEAENIFRNMYESDRTNLAALRALVNTYYEQGKNEAAITYLSQEIRRNNSADMRSMLGGSRAARQETRLGGSAV